MEITGLENECVFVVRGKLKGAQDVVDVLNSA
jgi:hypothetical protein